MESSCLTVINRDPQNGVPVVRRLIQLGDYAVLSAGGSTFRMLVHVRAGGQVKIGKTGMVKIDSLCGIPFGDIVEFNEKDQTFASTELHPDLDLTEFGEEDAKGSESKDNRNLVDTHGEAQSLTQEECITLKSEKGVESFLKELVTGSSTFQSKTSFAQEKYLRKKRSKYALVFKLELPSPQLMAELNSPIVGISSTNTPPASNSTKHCVLRADTVAQILHYSGICGIPGYKALLAEQTNGFLIASVLAQLGEEGKLYCAVPRDAQPNVTLAKQMKIEKITERLRFIPLNPDFLCSSASTDRSGPHQITEVSSLEVPRTLNEGQHEESLEQAQSAKIPAERPSMWMKGKAAYAELFPTTLQPMADTLIVCLSSLEDTVERVQQLFPFLAFSGTLIVYAVRLHTLEKVIPLIRDECVLMQVTETFCRAYQVLPSRTHPTVNMNAAGGYILTAIKVDRSKRTTQSNRPTTSALCETGPTNKRHRDEADEGPQKATE